MTSFPSAANFRIVPRQTVDFWLGLRRRVTRVLDSKLFYFTRLHDFNTRTHRGWIPAPPFFSCNFCTPKKFFIWFDKFLLIFHHWCRTDIDIENRLCRHFDRDRKRTWHGFTDVFSSFLEDTISSTHPTARCPDSCRETIERMARDSELSDQAVTLTETIGRCALGRLLVPVVMKGHSGVDSDFGESWRNGLHAAFPRKNRMALVKR